MGNSNESSSPLTEEEVRGFVEEKVEILRQNPDLNEEEIKAAVITDFIRLLGWQIPTDGRMEYQFGEHNTNVVDYALLDDGISKVFVEAKSPGISLENHRSQITEYLALDNVELGVLTNGEVYEIYRTHISEGDQVERQQVAQIELPDFPDRLDVLNSLTKEEVTTGSYKEKLQRVVDLDNARTTLDEHRQELARDIVSVVTDSVGSIAQEPARDYIAGYLDNIRKELRSTADTEPVALDQEIGSERAAEIEMRDNVIIDSLRDEPLFSITELSEILGDDEARVGVYPCDFERGLSFIHEHEAWGFIKIASQPDYFCIYLTRPYQQIQLIGKVEDLVTKDDFFAHHDLSRDPDEIDDGKKAILFESVQQLSDPIPIGEQSHRMQGLMYTRVDIAFKLRCI